MKILLANILYPPDGIGGSERSVQYLARGLSRLGHEVGVVSQAISEKTSIDFEEEIKITRIGSPAGYQPNVMARPKEEIEALKKSYKGRVIPFSKSLNELIAKEKPDIVHCNVVSRMADIWKYCKSKGVPIVQTLRSYSIMCSSRMLIGGRPCISWCSGCQSEYQNRLKESAGLSAVVGISEHILNTYVQQGFFANARVSEVIPNSYEARTVVPLPVMENKGKRITLGCLGRIHESKGIESILKSFCTLSDDRLMLKIAGSGNPDFIEYLKTRYGHAQIEFVGYVDPDEFINTLDALCVPSLWHEPFGRVNMESLAHGRPVIASSRGGIPEIIEDGVTGWLYEPYADLQFKGILEKIVKLSTTEWSSLHERCLQATKHYTVETVARQYEELYYKASNMV